MLGSAGNGADGVLTDWFDGWLAEIAGGGAVDAVDAVAAVSDVDGTGFSIVFEADDGTTGVDGWLYWLVYE